MQWWWEEVRQPSHYPLNVDTFLHINIQAITQSNAPKGTDWGAMQADVFPQGVHTLRFRIIFMWCVLPGYWDIADNVGKVYACFTKPIQIQERFLQ